MRKTFQWNLLLGLMEIHKAVFQTTTYKLDIWKFGSEIKKRKPKTKTIFKKTVCVSLMFGWLSLDKPVAHL